ncbi:MAG TPA: ImmA/IrrE family metallo-endopeptidase [Microlunatus sp.]
MVAAELGLRGEAPAPRETAEATLSRLDAAADHLAARQVITSSQYEDVRRRLKGSWASVRNGGHLTMRDVETLRRLECAHGVQLDAQQLLTSAQRRFERAKVAFGLASLQLRRDGDAVAFDAAAARRREASRLLNRAEEGVTATGAGKIRCPDCGQFVGDGHRCPLPPGLPAGDYGSLAGEARTKEMIADLQSAVSAIVQSGQLQRWLDAMASNGLHRWSLNNRLLALVQMASRGEALHDLHLMGFRQWDKYNRRVRKGEKAVWILAPMTRKIRETDGAGAVSERVLVTGFKSVPVFNLSQTDGDPMPAAPLTTPEGDVSPGTLDGLRLRVAAAGYSYQEENIPGCDPATGRGTLGYTDPATRQIVVDQRLGPAQKASTIAHELAHVHCGHVDGDLEGYRRHRGRMETEAEMTAYLVNRARGMSRGSANAFSPGYIAGWSRGDPAVITAAMDSSTKAFNKIMSGDWPADAAAESRVAPNVERSA